MNKILLKKLIRKEIKNLKEQSKDIMTEEISFSDLETAVKHYDQGNPYYDRTKMINIYNQLSDIDQQKAKETFPELFGISNDAESKSSNPTHAIQKMAGALGLDVSIMLGSGYNQITFKQEEDVEEKPFEQMIKFLEKLGYDVDLGQSVREYDYEPGERHFYPRIRF